MLRIVVAVLLLGAALGSTSVNIDVVDSIAPRPFMTCSVNLPAVGSPPVSGVAAYLVANYIPATAGCFTVHPRVSNITSQSSFVPPTNGVLQMAIPFYKNVEMSVYTSRDCLNADINQCSCHGDLEKIRCYMAGPLPPPMPATLANAAHLTDVLNQAAAAQEQLSKMLEQSQAQQNATVYAVKTASANLAEKITATTTPPTTTPAPTAHPKWATKSKVTSVPIGKPSTTTPAPTAHPRWATKSVPPSGTHKHPSEESRLAAKASAAEARAAATKAVQELERTLEDIEDDVGADPSEDLETRVQAQLHALSAVGIDDLARRIRGAAMLSSDDDDDSSADIDFQTDISIDESDDDMAVTPALSTSDAEESDKAKSTLLLPRDALGTTSSKQKRNHLGVFFGTGSFGKTNKVPTPAVEDETNPATVSGDLDQEDNADVQTTTDDSGDDDVNLLQSYASEPEPAEAPLSYDLSEARAREREALADIDLAESEMDSDTETGNTLTQDQSDLQRLRDAAASLSDGSIEEFLEQTETNLLQQADNLSDQGELDKTLMNSLQEDTTLLQKNGVDKMLNSVIENAISELDYGKPMPDFDNEDADVQTDIQEENTMPLQLEEAFARANTDVREELLDNIIATEPIRSSIHDEIARDVMIGEF